MPASSSEPHQPSLHSTKTSDGLIGTVISSYVVPKNEPSGTPGVKALIAAAPERNLLENGDFHRAAGLSIPGWGTHFAPALAENTLDFVTAGRSYDITQSTNGNDGMTTAFTVPETTDYVTVMVRYKNVSSAEPLFRVASGANAALFLDPVPPSDQPLVPLPVWYEGAPITRRCAREGRQSGSYGVPGQLPARRHLGLQRWPPNRPRAGTHRDRPGHRRCRLEIHDGHGNPELARRGQGARLASLCRLRSSPMPELIGSSQNAIKRRL